MHWLTLLIPLILAVFYKVAFRKKVLFWEFFLAIAANTILILLALGIYYKSALHDNMIVSGYVVGKKFIPEHQETRTETTTDSEGHSHTRTYTVTVPDDYNLYLGYKVPTKVETREAEYDGEEIGQTNWWGKDCSSERYHRTIIGEEAIWTESFDNPLLLNHSNLYNKKITTNYRIPHFPEIFDVCDMNRVTVISGEGLRKDYHKKVNMINSMLNGWGINMGVILTDYPDEYGDILEKSWVNGKPNDFVLILFTRGREVRSVKVIAWNNDYLKLKIADDILKVKSLDKFDDILQVIYTDIKQKGFQIKDFREFSYIKMQLPTWFLITLFLVSIGASIGLLEYFRQNEFQEDSYNANNYFSRRSSRLW